MVGAIQGYSADKTANMKATGRETPFLPYMIKNHLGMMLVGLVISILIALAIQGAGTDKCPRCGQPWSGDGVCFSCRADQKGYE